MASTKSNFATRTMDRIMRFFGTNNSAEISDTKRGTEETVHFGMFSQNELRHMDGVFQNMAEKSRDRLTEANISETLTSISSSTRKSIDELKNLRILAPEIDLAKSIIVSSIISPLEMQTDSIVVKVDHPGLDEDLNAAISTKLTDFFNKEYGLGPKLAEWLGCAGFEEGAKPILVLPKNQIDVLNLVGDKWDKETLKKFNEAKVINQNGNIGSMEGLADFAHHPLRQGKTKGVEASSESNDPELDALEIPDCFSNIESSMESFAKVNLEKMHAGKEFVATESKSSKTAKLSTSDQLAKALTKGAFKLLRTVENGDAVVVTKDIRAIARGETNLNNKLDELTRDAMKFVSGYDPSNKDSGIPDIPVMTISDTIKTGNKDMPVVIELPCDAVIPVCAPRDNKNHIGYYVLVDENGLPCRGSYMYNGGVTPEASNRLAMNAAKSVYGGVTINTFNSAGITDADTLNQMSQVFAVAVNHLLDAKLKKDGLLGLDIHMHEAVGKCLFFNLLSKNKIKFVFVPAPMMVYYRFDHRPDGTGKTFLEDIAYLLALRVTLTIAKMMAQVDNATKHRRIEVNIDEKQQNVIGALEQVRHAWLNKKAPQFTTDPATAAESIINQHLSIVPKGLVGNTDDLNITTETQYGQSQVPDDGFLDVINNWIGIGLKVPPSVLNQLSEAEYSRSVATSNLFFSNNVRAWQNIIKPYNKKFLMNYILANDQLLGEIREMIAGEKSGKRTETKTDIIEAEKDDANEVTSQTPNDDDTVETALHRVINTVELVLPPPNMATSKAHFEEINSQIDIIDKLLESIYNDDVASNDDVKNLMASVRAITKAKLLRDFLPRIGFHEVASVPSIEDISTDEPARLIKFLNNFKRRMDNVNKLASGQLGDGNASTDAGTTGGESTSSGEGEADEGGDESSTAGSSDWNI